GKPRIAFLLSQEAPWPRSHIDIEPTRVQAFRRELQTDGVVVEFTGGGDIGRKVFEAIYGWERGQQSPSVAADLAEIRRKRLEQGTEISGSVRRARQELSDLHEPVTAARLASALQPDHAEYGGGRFEKVVLNVDVGTRRPVDAWIGDVE